MSRKIAQAAGACRMPHVQQTEEYMWQIDKDFGYYKKWPWWDKQDVVKTAVKEWEKNRFHLHDGYARRLRGNDLGNGNASRELFDMDKGTIPWLYHKLHRDSA